MQTLSELHTHQADVRQIVEDVFQTMLGLEVEPARATWSAELDLVAAVVHYAGAWKGAILLECTPEQAFEMTSRLMRIPPPTAMNEDVVDCLGEMANMMAGNLKSVLTPGENLSMPSVVQGTDYTLNLCGGNIVYRQAFSGEVGAFWVTLVEMVKRKPVTRPVHATSASPPAR